jgi:hypothetical protein
MADDDKPQSHSLWEGFRIRAAHRVSLPSSSDSVESLGDAPRRHARVCLSPRDC